eukprot:1141408-Pelagomonas_calceolata.AAC.2
MAHLVEVDLCTYCKEWAWRKCEEWTRHFEVVCTVRCVVGVRLLAGHQASAKSDQDSIGAARAAPSLIRNAGVKEMTMHWQPERCGERYPYDDILGGTYKAGHLPIGIANALICMRWQTPRQTP